jgi:hypothetical protein
MEIEEKNGLIIFHLMQNKEKIIYDPASDYAAFISNVKNHKSASTREKGEIMDFIECTQKAGYDCPECDNSTLKCSISPMIKR